MFVSIVSQEFVGTKKIGYFSVKNIKGKNYWAEVKEKEVLEAEPRNKILIRIIEKPFSENYEVAIYNSKLNYIFIYDEDTKEIIEMLKYYGINIRSKDSEKGFLKFILESKNALKIAKNVIKIQSKKEKKTKLKYEPPRIIVSSFKSNNFYLSNSYYSNN